MKRLIFALVILTNISTSFSRDENHPIEISLVTKSKKEAIKTRCVAETFTGLNSINNLVSLNISIRENRISNTLLRETPSIEYNNIFSNILPKISVQETLDIINQEYSETNKTQIELTAVRNNIIIVYEESKLARLTKEESYLRSNSNYLGVFSSHNGKYFGINFHISLFKDIDLWQGGTMNFDNSISYNIDNNILLATPGIGLSYLLLTGGRVNEDPKKNTTTKIVLMLLSTIIPDGVVVSQSIVPSYFDASITLKPIQTRLGFKSEDVFISGYSSFDLSLNAYSPSHPIVFSPFYSFGNHWSTREQHSFYGLKLGFNFGKG